MIMINLIINVIHNSEQNRKKCSQKETCHLGGTYNFTTCMI